MPDRAGAGSLVAGGVRRALRRTPCVGVCSTTYGDLVCRGCKRFAHEIVGWNGYRDDQRDLVWERLNALLTDSVRAHLVVADETKLRSVAARLKVCDAHELPAEVLAFRTLRARLLPLEVLGLEPRRGSPSGDEAARAINTEFYIRSCANYEASFKTPTR